LSNRFAEEKNGFMLEGCGHRRALVGKSCISFAAEWDWMLSLRPDFLGFRQSTEKKSPAFAGLFLFTVECRLTCL
jgi:hypothetical protein